MISAASLILILVGAFVLFIPLLAYNPGTSFRNEGAFAAVKSDGAVIVWGSRSNGGEACVYKGYPDYACIGNPSSVSSSISSGVVAVYSTSEAFAALKTDGSVITWGSSSSGGDSSSVSLNISSGVVAVYSTSEAFAALKTDGSVITWGSSREGGDSSSVSSSISSGVVAVYSTSEAFAALKTDGSVITWGSSWGGYSSSVSSSISSGVVAVYSTSEAFAALKTDGSVITWGSSREGGDSSSVSLNISSGVSIVFGNTCYRSDSTHPHLYGPCPPDLAGQPYCVALRHNPPKEVSWSYCPNIDIPERILYDSIEYNPATGEFSMVGVQVGFFKLVRKVVIYAMKKSPEKPDIYLGKFKIKITPGTSKFPLKSSPVDKADEVNFVRVKVIGNRVGEGSKSSSGKKTHPYWECVEKAY